MRRIYANGINPTPLNSSPYQGGRIILYVITVHTNTARRGILSTHSPEQRDDIAVAVAPSNAIPEPNVKRKR
jgi:hypothetical protein